MSIAVDVVSVIDSIVAVFARLGVSLLGYNQRSLAYFNQLSVETQGLLLCNLRLWLESLEAASDITSLEVAEAESLRLICEKMDVTIDAEFFSCLRQGDVIEIYQVVDRQPEKTYQLWRNSRFISMCSYDLLLLMTTPMHQLFLRNVEVQEIINQRMREMLLTPRTMPCRIPEHDLMEVLHAHNRVFRITNRFAAPMYDRKGETIGFASNLRAELVGSAYRHLPHVAPLAP